MAYKLDLLLDRESPLIDFRAQVRNRGLVQPIMCQEFPLKDHQLVSRDQMIRNKRVILSSDKGTGKTLTILSIFEDEKVHKNIPGFVVLILCPEKGMGSFIRDIKKMPDHEGKIQLVYGSKASRERQWKNQRARYFVCTYSSYLSDLGVRETNRVTKELSTPIVPKWALNGSIDGVVFDEFHRQFRNRNSKAFQTFAKLFRHTEYVFPMSGSAMSKGPEDLWPALHLVDPKLWSSYWNYVYTWCQVDDGHFGKKVSGPRLAPPHYMSVDQERAAKWRAAVKPHIVHITSEMLQDMPPKTIDFLDVLIPNSQRQLHDRLRDEVAVETPDGEYIFLTNELTRINKLRNALICPKALSPEYEYGQGIADIFDDALDGGVEQYCVFTPFKDPIPHLAQYLVDRGASVWILQGGIGLDEQTRRIDAWRSSLGRATPEHPSIILGTIKYAESWEVPEARYGYFLGEEWDPEDNAQAEDRMRRLVSVGMTYIKYCRFLYTWQEHIVDVLATKKRNVKAMYKTWGQFKNLLYQKETEG